MKCGKKFSALFKKVSAVILSAALVFSVIDTKSLTVNANSEEVVDITVEVARDSEEVQEVMEEQQTEPLTELAVEESTTINEEISAETVTETATEVVETEIVEEPTETEVVEETATEVVETETEVVEETATEVVETEITEESTETEAVEETATEVVETETKAVEETSTEVVETEVVEETTEVTETEAVEDTTVELETEIVDAVAEEAVAETFSVTFIDKNGNQIGNIITVDAGSEVTDDMYPVAPVVTGYEFTGWSAGDADLSNVSSDVVIKAEYKAIEYTLTYYQNIGKGKVPKPLKVAYGETITLPTKEEANLTREGYEFVGWSTYKDPYGQSQKYTYPVYGLGEEYTMPAKSHTLYAVWAKVGEADAHFYIRTDGNIPDEPNPFPTKDYTKIAIKINSNITEQVYVFDRTGVKVLANLKRVPTVAEIQEVLPSYNPETEYILWYVIKNEGVWHVDGVLCNKQEVKLSYAINCPSAEFRGTYPATQCCVKDGELTVSDMANGTRKGYTFTGWNTKADGTGYAYSAGTQIDMPVDRVLYAQWKSDVYTVKYLNEDGSQITQGSYEYDQLVTVPSNPTKASDNKYTYEFKEWKLVEGTDLKDGKCQGDATYQAVFEAKAIDYTVKYLNEDGSEISTGDYEYDETVTVPSNPTKASDNKYTYEFKEWKLIEGTDLKDGKCQGDATYQAVFEAKAIDYTVKYLNEDGSEISTGDYEYDETVTVPSNPTKASDNKYTYEFKEWKLVEGTDLKDGKCQGDATYQAVFEAKAIDYTVKYLNEDGSEISTGDYEYDETVTVPSNPTKASDNKYTYEFKEWKLVEGTDLKDGKCQGDATYQAVFEAKAIDYTVKYLNEDGSEISTGDYEYDETVTVPSNPTKASDNKYTYEFKEWKLVEGTDLKDGKCQGDATYQAVFEAKAIDYTVKYLDYNDTLISEADYEYDETVTVPSNPKRSNASGYKYTFVRWELIEGTALGEGNVCQGDATYRAVYKSTKIENSSPAPSTPSPAPSTPAPSTVTITDEVAPLAAAPLTVIDDQLVPLADTITIMDEEVPLADTITIMDEEVPLASIPDTGDRSTNPIPFAAAGILALGGAFVVAKKNKKEE